MRNVDKRHVEGTACANNLNFGGLKNIIIILIVIIIIIIIMIIIMIIIRSEENKESLSVKNMG